MNINIKGLSAAFVEDDEVLELRKKHGLKLHAPLPKFIEVTNSDGAIVAKLRSPTEVIALGEFLTAAGREMENVAHARRLRRAR